MELPRARKMLHRARRAYGEMVAVRDVAEDFDYRFVICLTLMAAVGPVIEEEAKDHKAPDFPTWWARMQSGSPLRDYLSAMRNLELKQGQSTKMLHGFPSPPAPVLRSDTRSRRRSTAFAAGGPVVVQSIMIEDGITRPASRAYAFNYTWIFKEGAYAGKDVIPIIEQQLTWLENELIPGAESRTG